MTLVGPANGYYKTGRYSKNLPTRMAAKYREAQQDPDLLSLRHDVAALDARIGDVLTRVDTGESGVLWTRLQEAYEEFRVARLAGNTPANVQKMQTALARMEEAMTSGTQDWAAWGEVTRLWEQRRKLVESESRRLVALRAMITTERGMIMIAKLTDIITRHVTDKKALSAIVVEMQQIMTRDVGTVPAYEMAEGAES